VDEVAGVEGDTKEIGGDKTELSGADADDTDDGAIEGGDDPALPELFANEDGGGDSQDAGKIIEPDDVEQVPHMVAMSRCRKPRNMPVARSGSKLSF
jgi:hypothetical protein